MSRLEQITSDATSSRTRTFGGCATCRTRHVKCDEQRPSCSTCSKASLRCEGYKKSIFFSSERDTVDSVIRCRRPLLTEDERIRMSQRLASAVPPNEALRLLYQLDEECDKHRSACDLRVNRGPFGAFRLGSVSFAEPSRPNPRSIDETISSCELSSGIITQSPEEVIGFDRDVPLILGSSFSPWIHDLMSSSYEVPEQDIAPQASNPFDITMNPDCYQALLDSLAVPGMDALPVSAEPAGSNDHAQLTLWAHNNHTMPNPAPHTAVLTVEGHTIPEGAVCLLKHYTTSVIKSLTPFRHAKTPWHILFSPLSKNCLAALTLGDPIDHATMCVFRGTLAISAYSLGGTTQSPKWLQQADSCKERAREHVKLMLRSAYDIPKVAKYKTILMALITMTQLCIISGRREQTECYLLEAEKFIRLRGLTRKKSRKIRMLHHCYVHIRLIHESTFLSGINSRQRRHVREAVESSGTVTYFQDFPSFRLKQWNNLDREMLEVRTQEAGENDLFLERPGFWVATMYPEIFGIPEPWVFLLSQVIRLGNEKDAAEGKSASEIPIVKDFMRRAKALERCIIRLTQLNNRGNTRDVDPQVIENILYGMQCALEIYFYRRIYDVSSSMLQDKVIKTRDWLFRHEDTDPSTVFGYVEFIWPAFIASSEAEDRDVQQSFARWFTISAQQSGLPCFTKTLELVERIWQAKRSDPDGEHGTWLEIMRDDTLLST